MYFHFPTFFSVLRQSLARKHFHPRHFALGMVFLSLFLLLRTVVLAARLLDHLLFPGFKKQPIRSPVFIVGNPRSGTTFLHRVMARDSRFTYFRLYQTIFPSVLFYKLFAAAGRLDRLLGRPADRLLARISRRGFRGWESIHPTDHEKAESDEMLFVYAMLSPLIGLQFPFFQELRQAVRPDLLPRKEREKLKAYYRSCLQRHLYATGPDKVLLEKVALIAGRLQTVREVLPDMRIVHMLRNPYNSVPSLVSMFQVPWRSLAPQALQTEEAARGLKEMILKYYRIIYETRSELPDERFVEVRYQELANDPEAAVRRIYERFGLQADPEFNRALAEEKERARQYRSRHSYSLQDAGIDPAELFARLSDLFEAYGFEPDPERALAPGTQPSCPRAQKESP
jgi:hypothetical protein